MIQTSEQMRAAVRQLENRYRSVLKVPEDNPLMAEVQAYNSKVHRQAKSIPYKEPYHPKTTPKMKLVSPVLQRTLTHPTREGRIKRAAKAYLNGKTTTEIADEMHIARSAAYQLVKQAQVQGLVPRGRRRCDIIAGSGKDVFRGSAVTAAKHFHKSASYFTRDDVVIPWHFTGHYVFERTSYDRLQR